MPKYRITKWESATDETEGYYTVELQKNILGIKWWAINYDTRSLDDAKQWILDKIRKTEFDRGWKMTTVCEITSYPSKEIEVMYTDKPTIPPPKKP